MRDVTQNATAVDIRTMTSIGAEIGASKGSRTTREHDRKRKVMQELQEVKLEEQKVALAQKRLRLEKELAEMESSGK